MTLATQVAPGQQPPLTPDEKGNLYKQEEIIQNGLRTFFKVGTALSVILDCRLYRANYGSFAEYCEKRWDLICTRGYQLVWATRVASEVMSTMVDTPAPTSERQLRPLANLPPEERPGAWQEAAKTAPEGKITARHVQSVVAKRKQKIETTEKAAKDNPTEEGSTASIQTEKHDLRQPLNGPRP